MKDINWSLIVALAWLALIVNFAYTAYVSSEHAAELLTGAKEVTPGMIKAAYTALKDQAFLYALVIVLVCGRKS